MLLNSFDKIHMSVIGQGIECLELENNVIPLQEVNENVPGILSEVLTHCKIDVIKLKKVQKRFRRTLQDWTACVVRKTGEVGSVFAGVKEAEV